MPAKGKKSLPILAETHRLISMEAAATDRDMYDLIDEAWHVYKASGATLKPDSKGLPDPGSVKSQPDNIHLGVRSHSQPGDARLIEITPGEFKWVIRFLNILRSGEVAARALKWNIMMVLKGMGIPYEAQDRPLAKASRSDERAARREIEIAERLIAESEEDPEIHSPGRKGHSGTEG